jgi:phenylacetate-CoA ligase
MRVQGRVDDMLIIRGINVFPSQVESVLMHVPELGDNYQLIVDRVHELDTMKVRVEVTKGKISEETNELLTLKKKISHMMRTALSIDVDAELVEVGTIPRSMGKAKRVVDNRKL